MKRLILVILFLILILSAIAAWIFLGPATGFSEKATALYIGSNSATKKAVIDSVKKNRIVHNEWAFEVLANQLDYWKNIKPGKYEIPKGSSIVEILRMLRNGRQTPVEVVIIKFRTKEDLAGRLGRKFESDSARIMSFLNSADSLKKFNTTPETSMAAILPDNYTYFWNSTPSQIYEKMYRTSQKFWTDERKDKAKAIGLSPTEVTILASIIEEETTNQQEKDTIASVYLNRLKKGMPLGADPTLKFATRQFELKRIAGEILNVESPYNTYQNTGLPPGPICTPSRESIDAVLNPATTGYYYFVANSRLNGHLFSTTFEEHVARANQYREEDKKRREQDSLKNGLK